MPSRKQISESRLLLMQLTESLAAEQKLKNEMAKQKSIQNTKSIFYSLWEKSSLRRGLLYCLFYLYTTIIRTDFSRVESVVIKLADTSWC